MQYETFEVKKPNTIASQFRSEEITYDSLERYARILQGVVAKSDMKLSDFHRTKDQIDDLLDFARRYEVSQAVFSIMEDDIECDLNARGLLDTSNIEVRFDYE